MEAVTEEPTGTEIIELPGPSSPTLFGTSQPEQVIERAAAHATALAKVIEDRKLFTVIKGRKHTRVEGWTLLGSMLGVFPVLEWTKEITGAQGELLGFAARVQAKTLAGATVGAAEAECLMAESNWKDRDRFAVKSMAQTRATSKALRLPLGFVMSMAGYEAAPAEEMVEDGPPRARNSNAGGQRQPGNQQSTRPARRQAQADAAVERHQTPSAPQVSEADAGNAPDGTHRAFWADFGHSHEWKPAALLRRIRQEPEGVEVTDLDGLDPGSPAGLTLRRIVEESGKPWA